MAVVGVFGEASCEAGDRQTRTGSVEGGLGRDRECEVMARPKNPLGDPVRVYRDGDYHKIRFYPSGVITRPEDRVRFEGRWFASCETATREAHEVAARLRASLVAHCAAHGASPVSGDQMITVRATIVAFLEDLAEDLVPTGTINARL